MTKFYEGSPVTIIRAAQAGDDGYDETKDQILIERANKTRVIVLRTEITSTEG